MSKISIYNPKQKPEPSSPAIDCVKEIDQPLDYSFCQITKPSEISEETPRIYSPRKIKTSTTEGGKSASRCLRLNNNQMTDMCGLHEAIEELFQKPSDVAWVDLSFNQISEIDPSICKCENLQILYLHGNIMTNLNEVKKLSSVPKLRKLTLHGNPLENEKGYRQHILSLLPNLQELDFSPITKGDKKTAETWQKMNCGGKRKKEKREDKD